MSENENVTSSIETIKKGFFGKLSNGDFGLAKTFWLYTQLPYFVLQISFVYFMSTSSNSNIGLANSNIGLVSTVGALVWAVYAIPLSMGTWRAANKYEGTYIWVVLGKFIAVYLVFQIIASMFALVSFLLTGSPIIK